MSLDKLTDQQIALILLMDNGASRSEALEALAFDPSGVGRLAPAIAAKRSELAAELAAASEQDRANSPAGRAEAAKAALAAAGERAEVVAGARLMLADQGYPANEDSMSDESVLHHAGIERNVAFLSQAEKDAEADRLSQTSRWRQLTAMEQAQQAAALGVSAQAVEQQCRLLEGNHEPVVKQWTGPVAEGAEGAGG